MSGRRAAAFGLALLAACATRRPDPPPADPPFAALVAELSEPGGYFDTDNLISNEASYLQALGPLARAGVRGGVYLGVGPDQNFSYIARIRPAAAFILDIRRDNLLEHLLFKALFALAPTRLEYLALLFGRAPPADPAAWAGREVDTLLAWIDAAPADSLAARRARRLVDSTVATFGLALSDADRATLARFHQTFMREGLDLRFESFGRGPAWYYPTDRGLLAERDRDGRQASYLADAGDFGFLRDLERRDRVVPVVGDFAGGHALAAIAQYLEARGLAVSAFYTSNVEFYLYRSGAFARFAENVARLPRSEASVLIRSVFLTSFGSHPDAVPGYASVQLVQSLPRFVAETRAGRYQSYSELVTRDILR